MAHIATCMASLDKDSIIGRSSPSTSLGSTASLAQKFDKPIKRKMLQAEQSKYNIFPKDKVRMNQTVNPTDVAVEVAANGDKQANGAGLRQRLAQQNSSRRRKIVPPELDPMTTVQEFPMDSPTIPGRPPLHERSASAPVNVKGERILPPSVMGGNMLADNYLQHGNAPMPPRPAPPRSSSRQPVAHLKLNPELQPSWPQERSINATLRSGSTPPMSSSRSPRADAAVLSRTRTPPSSSTPNLVYPRSTTKNIDAASIKTLPNPDPGPVPEFRTASPRPWGSVNNLPIKSEGERRPHVHRRGKSESATSIMDRGRPRKRTEARDDSEPFPFQPQPQQPQHQHQHQHQHHQLPLQEGHDKKHRISHERRASDELPKGWSPSEAGVKMRAADIKMLQKQALGQVERFEVLKAEDVDALSRELRRLDDRADYLRRTYTSLRAGRRNLHTRLCQYLRSPRVAKFSSDSMLKQEEALAELDASIDDWVTKLEQADDRRSRIRQKLLEHVAAAATLPGLGPLPAIPQPSHQAMATAVKSPTGPRELSTPPGSPSNEDFKNRTAGRRAPSPQRVVAQVPSIILEQPLVEDAADRMRASVRSGHSSKRSDVESIRIYAGDDVYALLADVENEISKMSSQFPNQTATEESFERQAQRQRSREKLVGHSYSSRPVGARSSSAPAPTDPLSASPGPSPTSIPPSTPPSASSTGNDVSAPAAMPVMVAGSDIPPNDYARDASNAECLFLTPAVFKP